MSTTAAMPEETAEDSREFDRWFHGYHLLVYRTACVITRSPEDAEDVLQTIFLRLMRRLVPPDIHKNPKGYFYKAAVNHSLDMLRARRREVLTSDFASIEHHFQTGVSNVEGALDALDERLSKALAELSPRAVEIVTLRYVHDYT